MGLTLKSVAQFASDLQAGVMSLTSAFTDWSSGSPELALAQAFGRAFGFIQNQAVAIVAFARAGTSFNGDLDSYVADYVPVGFTPRLQPTYDSGFATFTRNQASITQQILAFGTIIQNATPSIASAVPYQVIADPTNTNPLSSATLGGWILAPGQTTLTPNVQAVNPGTGSNVIAGALTVIASPGVPFDSVTNPNPINNAQNEESDVALLARFTKWMTGLGGGTVAVNEAQILSVAPGITYTMNEGVNGTDSVQVPMVTWVVDDGSGAIPAITIANIKAAIDLKRAPGMPRTVIPATNVPMVIAVTGTAIASGFNPTAVRAAIQAAIIAFVAQNGVGGANASNFYTPSLKFPYVPLANLVASFIGVGAGQGLSSYAEITINGASADIALTTFQLATSNASTVTVA